MPKVNPEILVWARETAGLTVAEAARKIAAADTLTALEDGTKEPTRPQLVKMARHYRRPLIAFYLSKPPTQQDSGTDFRTLPSEHSAADDVLLNALLRDVRARQSMVRDVLEDEDETEPLAFIGAHKTTDGRRAVLKSLQALLDVNVEEYRRQPKAHAAFELLRERAEKAGVFVLLINNLGSHHTSISTDIFRGFAIADPIAPFVIINRNDAQPAWSFTLLHELAHLLLGQTGISAASGRNVIEQFCNDVAGEFLLPADEAQHLVLSGTSDNMTDQISQFADERNLSRTLVAYRAYRAGAMDQATFNHLTDNFSKQWIQERDTNRKKERTGQGGPNYYVIRHYQVGKALVELAQQKMSAGELTTSKAAKVLGVKPGQVHLLFNAGKRSQQATSALPH